MPYLYTPKTNVRFFQENLTQNMIYIMRKKLLFSALLLFLGVSMHAQSVADETMDERFNDGTKLPYGWFTEGWTVKDGAIQTEASSGFNFDMESLLNGGDPEGTKGDDPEGTKGDDPEEAKGDDPEENKNDFDISSLLESLMGGGGSDNYLLTPPLVVNEGESLVFSAKKGKSDDSGSGMSFSLGSSDSTFVVERTIYSRNQWVRVADFTTELDTIYKTFTIADTPAGEYRFRFRAAGTVLIDSVAGFHIDSEAPDLYIIENDARAYHIDFSLCTKDSTRTLKVINTATGTLKVDITSDDAALFSVSPGHLEVAAADTLDVNITFHFAAGQPGKNEAQITFTPADERVYGKSLNATAVVTQPGVWMEDFDANIQPKGFFTEGWEFHDNVATTSSGDGMAAMFGGGSSSFLMTPPLKVESIDEVLLFSARKGSGDDGGFDMGSLFGGGGSSVVIEKSVYGSNKWEKVKEYTEPLDSVYRTLWVGYIEPGEYRFRIIASDSIVIDSIAGFHLDNNAPDIYVLHNNTAASAVNFGMPQANSTARLAVVNTGTGSLQGGIMCNNMSDFALSAASFAVEASDTAYIDVTYLFNEASLGIHQGVVTFAPTTSVLVPLSYPLTAYSTYADAWTENFEPEFLREDETQPIDLPVGWETTGWEVKMPSSGGGLMDMLGGLMGGGGAAPKTYMATTGSDAYELITPCLQAKKGDVLRFEAELGGGGMMAMMSMFMGGGASGQLTVYYRLENGDSWTYYDTFVQSGYAYFVAPSSGVYQLRFTSPGASLDNFYGFRKPIGSVALSDNDDAANTAVFEKYNGQTVNVSYDRVLSAVQKDDGTFVPKAYSLCLPYDFRFSELAESGKIKVYQLSSIDNYYKRFVFTAVDDVAEAGKAYLAVVNYGEVSLNAYNVTLTTEPVSDSELTTVIDYEDLYCYGNSTKVGQWAGSFSSISATEADSKNMFCLLSDGSWARFTSQDNPEARLKAFRSYYSANASADQPAGTRGPGAADREADRFHTLFMGSMSDGSAPDALNILYEADIPIPFLLGDANGDGVLNEADVKAIADHIMGQTPANFNKKNADVNGDSQIDIADIVELIEK